MRIRKGNLIRVKVGHELREGVVTEFHSKNRERTLSYGDWWCYLDQIKYVHRNGKWIEYIK